MAYSLAFSQAISILAYIYIKTELGNEDYLSTRAISEALNIPAPTIVKVIKSLNNADLIRTKEGLGGGMSLRKNPSEIELLEIFVAVESNKPLFKFNFNVAITGEKVDAVGKEIESSLLDVEHSMKDALKRKTLASIIDKYSL